jgi:predicted RNA-binding Zn-ribbon protein involved in translation (DUF1610 family)
MKKQGKLPTSAEFVAFWQAENAVSWRKVLPWVIYPSGFAIYAVVVRLIVNVIPGRFWWAYLGLGVAYIVLVPYAWMRFVWKHYARFIRCPQCGDWLGRGDYNWKSISQTGVCAKCGQQLLDKR